MRLVSFNIALFEANNDKLQAFLKDLNADILCFQEVARKVGEQGLEKYNSKPAIDEATPELPYGFFAPLWVLDHFAGKPEVNAQLGGWFEFGTYIKSRYPIIKGQQIFVQNHLTYITDWSKWPEEEYRAVQVVDIDARGRRDVDIAPSSLRVINYHGIWTKGKMGNKQTLKAAEVIKTLALEKKGPVIICGDFNLFPDNKAIQILSQSFRNLGDEFEIKTTRPASNEFSERDRNVVDYMFVNEKVQVKKFEVLESDVSDHLPLVLDIEVR